MRLHLISFHSLLFKITFYWFFLWSLPRRDMNRVSKEWCCVINSTGDINSLALSSTRSGGSKYFSFAAMKQWNVIERNAAVCLEFQRLICNLRINELNAHTHTKCLYPQKGKNLYIKYSHRMFEIETCVRE